jgi:hypothetical protein
VFLNLQSRKVGQNRQDGSMDSRPRFTPGPAKGMTGR